jgi:hypothetical protein
MCWVRSAQTKEQTSVVEDNIAGVEPRETGVRCRDHTSWIETEEYLPFFIKGCTSANAHDGGTMEGEEINSIYYMLFKAWGAGWWSRIVLLSTVNL